MKPLLEELENRCVPSALAGEMNAFTAQVYQVAQQEASVYQQDFGGAPPLLIQLQGAAPAGYLFPGSNGQYYGQIGVLNDQIHAQTQEFFGAILPLYYCGQLDSQDVQTAIEDGQLLEAIQQAADDYLYTFAFYDQAYSAGQSQGASTGVP